MRMAPDDIALAHALADAAGDVIRPFFRRRFTIETKADASPVTEVDRAVEAAIRQLLAAHRPDDGVIGEEYGEDRPKAERVWVIDPIDGTRAFLAGRPLFGTLIALLEAGEPVLGVIDQPIARDRWLGAKGERTTLNGAPAETRACAALAKVHIATTGPSYFKGDSWAAFERLRGECRDVLWGGDCHNYGLLASGHLDLVVEAGLKLYDFAALVPVVEGAGGRMTDWNGKPLGAESDGRVIAAGDPGLIEAAVEVLAC
ncbi:histidinol phosphatase-like enzyme (inositol monophosphatase family) [Sphingomonas vulcanisoli]|uniref:Histidinol-phosphatase n=2 Tax=Sphingomonas vulcanisoli TaxID=1658060 RepID=A0ABX0TS53_9SPHN|nr:histidinol phosphatase-like enzyme (inositol monophosphatase family) [Sphingomonas vulcanisoli]